MVEMKCGIKKGWVYFMYMSLPFPALWLISHTAKHIFVKISVPYLLQGKMICLYFTFKLLFLFFCDLWVLPKVTKNYEWEVIYSTSSKGKNSVYKFILVVTDVWTWNILRVISSSDSYCINLANWWICVRKIFTNLWRLICTATILTTLHTIR